MALVDAGAPGRIESGSVVPDGEIDPVVIVLAADHDMGGLAVADGIGGQFADDAQDGVDDVVPECVVAHGEVDRDIGLVDDGGKGLPYGLVKRRLVDRQVAEIPQAVPEIVAAALHLQPDAAQVGEDERRVLLGDEFGRVKLEGDARQVLRKRVVQFDGETRPLLFLQFRRIMAEALLDQRAAAVLDQMVERAVPGQDRAECKQKDRQDEDEASGGPPGGRFEDLDVVFRPQDELRALDARIAE